MKHLSIQLFLIFLLMIVTSVSCLAQDIIVLKNDSTIEARVIDIGIEEITYKKWNFDEGPDYKILKKEVRYIQSTNGAEPQLVYQSGLTGQIIYDSHNPYKDSVSQAEYLSKLKEKGVIFSFYLEAGCPFTASAAGPSLHFTFGARVYDCCFAGLTIGSDVLFITQNGNFVMANIPFLLNIRGLFPLKNKSNLYPFFDFSLGGNLSLTKPVYEDDDGNFYQSQSIIASTATRLRICFGLEYKRFIFALGYDLLAYGHRNNINMGYAKVGIKLGKQK